MTPEQKAKAYDKVREKIVLRFGSNVAEEIFSEFEKSKDERIRSIIRGWIYTRPSSFFDNGISKEDILAWLKKEFDDEKVRRALIDYFEDAHKADEDPLQSYGIHTDIAIAWLEKRATQEEPQVYETRDGEVITYSETKGYKVVSTTLGERIKSEPLERIPFEELKDQKNVNIS